MAFITVFILIALSCAKSSNPISLDIERHLSEFYDAIEIFGPTTNGNFDERFHDISLAQTCYATPGYDDMEFGGDHGCIAITLNRADNDPSTPFKPVFRWLDSDNYDTSDSPISYVCLRDAFDPDNSAEYRAIACDAIYNPAGSGLNNIEPASIEVVVAYMVKNRPNVPGDTEWDIEVTAMQWTGGNVYEFWKNPPNYRIIRSIPDDSVTPTDQFNPDIAYNTDNGDVYIVYSDVLPDSDEVHLKYRKYIRLTDAVSNEYLAQSLGHNGYDPSIDVGRITWQGVTRQWVAIGYTAQFDNQMGYHVNITAWPYDPAWPDIDRVTTYRMRNPQYMYKDAGLPCVDIAPDANMEHVGAIIYTQVTGSDSYGAKTESFVVRFLGAVADLNQHIRVKNSDILDPDFIDTLYPSIAINRQDSMPSNIYASLAFMGQDIDVDLSDNWHPRVASMKIYDYQDPGNPDAVGILWNGPADIGGNNDLIIGNYNLSDIPFQNPGVASAIMTTNGDMYWAAWNDRFEMEPPPSEVWASWGYADY
jgi:hypothetical protein